MRRVGGLDLTAAPPDAAQHNSQTRRETEMDDSYFVFARKLVWNNDAWREPARIGLAISILQQILASENASHQQRAEAEMLVKKLYNAGKKPAGAI